MTDREKLLELAERNDKEAFVVGDQTFSARREQCVHESLAAILRALAETQKPKGSD